MAVIHKLTEDAGIALVDDPEAERLRISVRRDVVAYSADLISSSDAAKGAGRIGFSAALAYAAGTVGKYLKDLAAGAGSALVGFIQAGAGAIARTLQAKARERVSTEDFDVRADFNGATGTDDTAALQAAFAHVQTSTDPATYTSNSPAAGSGVLEVASGNSKVAGTLVVTKRMTVQGRGPAERASGSRWLQFGLNVDMIQINPISQGTSFAIVDMTLAGTVGGTGHLINNTGTLAGCNSARILRCFFYAPPSGWSVRWARGDDLRIEDSVFDVSNNFAVWLGLSVLGFVVTNSTVVNNDFFEIPKKCLILYNVVGLDVSHNRVTRQPPPVTIPPTPPSRTEMFADGFNSLPLQIREVQMIGNVLDSVDCMFKLNGVVGLTVSHTVAVLAGASATLAFWELVNPCDRVALVNNNISGDFSQKPVYDDTAAVVTAANLSGNILVNTGGGTVPALRCGNTTGVIANNTFVGFTVPSVSQRWLTTLSTGALPAAPAAGSVWLSATHFVSGAGPGDRIDIAFTGTAFPLPAGVTINGLIVAADTLRFVVRNGSAGAVTPADFEVACTVSRGV